MYFCLKNAKKKELGQPGLTLENIEKPLVHFASPRPRKPLNCLKKLYPSPKTIEVFGKPPPVPFPCDRGEDREGDPFIQCPPPSSLVQMCVCMCKIVTDFTLHHFRTHISALSPMPSPTIAQDRS